MTDGDKTIQLTDEEIVTLVTTLQLYMETKGISDKMWLSRQDRCADVDWKLRKLLHPKMESYSDSKRWWP